MTAATKQKEQKTRKYCGICGIALRAERWIYSRHSNERYCPVSEWDACAERADKKVVKRG